MEWSALTSSRVLVVDDERSVLTTLEVVLKRSGYEVIACDEEAQALEAFRTHKPDIVLQDLRMGGPGGLELLKRFKAIAPQVPVIIITAYSTWDNAVAAMRLGAYDFIRKPYDNDAIREIVARALAQRRATRVGRGAGHGRLLLGAAEPVTPLPPSLSFFRDLACRHVAALCALPDLDAAGTKARAAPPADLGELCAEHAATEAGSTVVREVVLFRSTLRPRGPAYDAIWRGGLHPGGRREG